MIELNLKEKTEFFIETVKYQDEYEFKIQLYRTESQIVNVDLK